MGKYKGKFNTDPNIGIHFIGGFLKSKDQF